MLFDTIKGSACSYSDICTAFLKPYNTLEHTSIIIKPYVYLERFFSQPYVNLETPLNYHRENQKKPLTAFHGYLNYRGEERVL